MRSYEQAERIRKAEAKVRQAEMREARAWTEFSISSELYQQAIRETWCERAVAVLGERAVMAARESESRANELQAAHTALLVATRELAQ